MPIVVSLPLSDDQAEALAQLCKRFSYSDAERLSDPPDSGFERDRMIDAVSVLRKELAERGFAPR